MARKRSSGKITRRDAVTMLSAGAMLGGVGTGSEAAATRTQSPPCSVPAVVSDFQVESPGNKPRPAMLASACCEESHTAVLAGTTGTKQPTQYTRSHLKPLTDRLQRESLDEYCFMIWGLTNEQVKMLTSMVPERLGLKPRVRAK